MKRVVNVLVCLMLLSGCFGEILWRDTPFYAYWSKTGAKPEDIIQALTECDLLPNASWRGTNLLIDKEAFMFVCMHKKGFLSTGPDTLFSKDVCNGFYKDFPSCVAYKRGYPMTAEELEVMETILSYSRFHTRWAEYGWRDPKKMTQEAIVEWRLTPYPPSIKNQEQREKAEQVKERWKGFIETLRNQMKVCGYPEIIESTKRSAIRDDTPPKTVSYAELGRMERCMEKAGYEYEYPKLKVCVMYPQIRGCE